MSNNCLPSPENTQSTYGVIDPYEAQKRSELEARRERLLNEERLKKRFSRKKRNETAKNVATDNGSGEPVRNKGLISENLGNENSWKSYSTRFRGEKYYHHSELTKCLFYKQEWDKKTSFDYDWDRLLHEEKWNSSKEFNSFSPLRVRLLDHYQKLARQFDLSGKNCSRKPRYKGIHVAVYNDSEKIGLLNHAQCDSIYCPICSVRLEIANAKRLRNAIEYHITQSQGVVVSFVLNYRHELEASLDPKDTFRRFSSACSGFISHLKEDLEKKASVVLSDYHSKIESTFSRVHSWHDHLNLALFIHREDGFSLEGLEKVVFNLWCKQIKKHRLGKPDKKVGVKGFIIDNVEDGNEYAKYVSKNSSDILFNSAAEVTLTGTKTGHFKNGVRRWQPFELLMEGVKYEEKDLERSTYFSELFVENVKRTSGHKLTRWGKRGLFKKSDEFFAEEENKEKEKSKEQQQIKAFCTGEVLEISREEKILSQIVQLARDNVDLSGQERTDVISNVGVLCGLLDEPEFDNVDCSPSQYLSAVFAGDAGADLATYIFNNGNGLDYDFIVQSVKERFNRIDFDDYLEHYEEYIADEIARLAERCRESARFRREAEYEEKVYLQKTFRKSSKRSLMVRYLTFRERKEIRKELHRIGEIDIFEGLLNDGINPVDFIRSLKGKKHFELKAMANDATYHSVNTSMNIYKHWQKQPEPIIERYYIKWFLKYITPFDLVNDPRKFKVAKPFIVKGSRTKKAREQVPFECMNRPPRMKKGLVKVLKEKEKVYPSSLDCNLEWVIFPLCKPKYRYRVVKEFTVHQSKHIYFNGL